VPTNLFLFTPTYARTATQIYAAMRRRAEITTQLQQLGHLSSNENLELYDDFNKRLGVLRTLGYIDEENTVQLKGRVASEVNTADELLLTELVFENVLAGLSPPELVSILSALIFQRKNDDEPILTPSLDEARATVTRIANALGAVQTKSGLDIDGEGPLLNWGLAEVSYEWARGVSFAELTTICAEEEGTIVRTINRLDETLREVSSIARIIGDPELFRNAQKGAELIKRDIVFAASLYL
jgi:antiviral helicase SKI2